MFGSENIYVMICYTRNISTNKKNYVMYVNYLKENEHEMYLKWVDVLVIGYFIVWTLCLTPGWPNKENSRLTTLLDGGQLRVDHPMDSPIIGRHQWHRATGGRHQGQRVRRR